MDLTTTYLGLKLKHPIVPSASPLSRNLDSIRRLEDADVPFGALNDVRGLIEHPQLRSDYSARPKPRMSGGKAGERARQHQFAEGLRLGGNPGGRSKHQNPRHQKFATPVMIGKSAGDK